MRTFRQDLEKNLQDPVFRAEREAPQPEMAAVRAIIKVRTEKRDYTKTACGTDRY